MNDHSFNVFELIVLYCGRTVFPLQPNQVVAATWIQSPAVPKLQEYRVKRL